MIKLVIVDNFFTIQTNLSNSAHRSITVVTMQLNVHLLMEKDGPYYLLSCSSQFPCSFNLLNYHTYNRQLATHCLRHCCN